MSPDKKTRGKTGEEENDGNTCQSLFTNRFCFAKEIARGRWIPSWQHNYPPLAGEDSIDFWKSCPMKPIMNGDDEAKAVSVKLRQGSFSLMIVALF